MSPVTDKIKKGRKFQQVLEGACKVFMADGFEGASVDTIAKVAGVSKATLYSYFPDKRVLFTEAARMEIQRQAAEAAAESHFDAPPRVFLCEAGKHMLRFMTSDFGLSVFRICVAENPRFPELGKNFYESGPQIAKQVLVTYFEHAQNRGELDIPDKSLAACQFAELCKADLFNKRLFGIRDTFTQDEIDRVVDGAVDMFMARYGS